MDNISQQEKEFLKKVYCKADCLEYEKRQQDLILENERQIRKVKIRNGVILSLLFILVALVNTICCFNAVVLLCSLIFLIVPVSYYEFELNI